MVRAGGCPGVHAAERGAHVCGGGVRLGAEQEVPKATTKVIFFSQRRWFLCQGKPLLLGAYMCFICTPRQDISFSSFLSCSGSVLGLSAETVRRHIRRPRAPDQPKNPLWPVPPMEGFHYLPSSATCQLAISLFNGAEEEGSVTPSDHLGAGCGMVR